jgi:hypothetical protein
MLGEGLTTAGFSLLALGWYAIFMIIALPLLGIGWVIYIRWDRKMEAQEEQERKKGSNRLNKTRTEVSDWAQQMSKMETPKRRPPHARPPESQ